MAMKRAAIITVKELSLSIEGAVKLAAERHQVKAEPSSLLINF
jgi:hypothetical protein